MGKIERIQLRGISRSPSDRMVTDGGCAESLNVQLDHGELTPMPKPGDISDTVFPDDWYTEPNLRALYIHKGTYYTNYIFAADYGPENTTRSYTVFANVNGDVSRVASFDYDPSESDIDPVNELASVTSVGNTLVISFNGEMMYSLFKDGEYRALGNQIPIPNIRFYGKTGHYDDDTGDFIREIRTEPTKEYAEFSSRVVDVDDVTAYGDVSTVEMIIPEGADLNPEKWGQIHNGYKAKNEFQLATLNIIWEDIVNLSSDAAANGKLIFPIILRYGVRLYDGTVYGCSTPIMVGADVTELITSTITSHIYGGTKRIYKDALNYKDWTLFLLGVKVTSATPFSVVADFSNISSDIYDDWEDIVTGVSLFSSTPLMPMVNSETVLLKDSYRQDGTGQYDQGEQYFATAVLDPKRNQDFESIINLHQETYLAKEWTIKELTDLSEEEELNVDWSPDWLSTQEVLRETYNSLHSFVGHKLSSYNKRLVLEGASLSLYPGYPFFPSTKIALNVDDSSFYPMEFKWHLRIDGEEKIVFTRNINGGTEFISELIEDVDGGLDFRAFPATLLTYPDARAYRVDIAFTTYGGPQSTQKYYRSFTTKTFSGIDAAYVYFGLGENILSQYLEGKEITEEEWGEIAENKIAIIDDQLIMSASSNPFIFPASGVVDFDESSIIGTGMVTKALSQGQFGQYPLYVFTSSGIWTLNLNSEGDFVSKHAVSRDVALDGTIAPIDQAIVFTTKKGEMMLTGSDIVNISPDMNGKHYTLESDPISLFDTEGYSKVVNAASNPDSFIEYMSEAKPAYDYAGERLIFINKDYDTYMYVYRLPTGTWHKMAMIEHDEWDVRLTNVLNSYPDAILSATINGYAKAYNMSTVLDQTADADTIGPGLIATRPIDFGLPDIYKSVTRVKIRGEVDRSNNHSPFKYILLGSNDGVTWAMLHSLRGPSFKLFRLIILTTLNSTERISYAEIEYEPRFTNKIR